MHKLTKDLFHLICSKLYDAAVIEFGATCKKHFRWFCEYKKKSSVQREKLSKEDLARSGHLFGTIYPRSHFFYYCQSDLQTVKALLSKRAYNFDSGLNGACSAGNPEIIDLMLELGASDFSKMFASACVSGDPQIISKVTLFLKSKSYPIVLSKGLESAALKGNFELAQELIKLGAAISENVLYAACRSRNRDLIKFLLQKSSFDAGSLREALTIACAKNDLDLVKLLLSKEITDCSEAFEKACDESNVKIVCFFIENKLISFNKIHEQLACFSDDFLIFKTLWTFLEQQNELPEIKEFLNRCNEICDPSLKTIKFLLQKGATCRGSIFRELCRAGHLELIKLALPTVKKIEEGFVESCKSSSVETVEFFLDLLKNPDLDAGLATACNRGQKEVAILLEKRGAKHLKCCY